MMDVYVHGCMIRLKPSFKLRVLDETEFKTKVKLSLKLMLI